jgi:hypothetical protein
VSIFLRKWTIFIFGLKVVLLDFGETDKYSHELPPYSVVVYLDDLWNIKSRGHENNFIHSFSLSFVAIMGWDGFLPCWDTCRLGDGCTPQCLTVSLNTGTAPFTSQSFFFFQKYFGSSYSPSFNLLGGFVSSGKLLLRRPPSTALVSGDFLSIGKSTFFSLLFHFSVSWLYFEWLRSKKVLPLPSFLYFGRFLRRG